MVGTTVGHGLRCNILGEDGDQSFMMGVLSANAGKNLEEIMFKLVYQAPDSKNFLVAARRVWSDFGLLHRHEQLADYRLESS